MRYPQNFQEVHELRDATELINYEVGLGQGYGTSEISVTKSDVSSQSSFANRQKVASYKEVSNVTILGDIAQQDINKFKSPQLTYKLIAYGNSQSPVPIVDYQLGDIIRTIVDDDAMQVDINLRVFETHIKIDDQDFETIEIVGGLI